MKKYKVYITVRAYSDLRSRIGYLRNEKKTIQAAQAALLLQWNNFIVLILYFYVFRICDQNT